MNLQPLFWTVAFGAWIVGFGAVMAGNYRQLTSRKPGKTTLVFLCGMAVFAATILLAHRLGYQP